VNAEDLLTRVDALRTLKQKHIVQLARTTALRPYTPRQTSVSPGDTGLGLYIIASSGVEVRAYD
jgi:hypothetical protein